MDKMTDNEIIKALECCVKEEYHCKECAYECDKHFNKKSIEFDIMPNGISYDQRSCDEWLKKDVLDLINRQKAEIERLEHQLETLCLTLKLAKAEAVKEFAEVLKEKTSYAKDVFDYTEKLVVDVEEIDNTLKEMTEQ